MLSLRQSHGVSADRIGRIELEVAPQALHVCNIQEPKTGLEAKFSFRVACAMALLGDDTGDINAYSAERATSAEVVALRDRISVTANAGLSGGLQVASVELTDGRRITVSNDSYKPLNDVEAQREQVSRKFLSLAGPIIGRAAAGEVRRLVYRLPFEKSVKPLLSSLATSTVGAEAEA
jgi:2-methylcitrate dehydratase PrpD